MLLRLFTGHIDHGDPGHYCERLDSSGTILLRRVLNTLDRFRTRFARKPFLDEVLKLPWQNRNVFHLAHSVVPPECGVNSCKITLDPLRTACSCACLQASLTTKNKDAFRETACPRYDVAAISFPTRAVEAGRCSALSFFIDEALNSLHKNRVLSL